MPNYYVDYRVREYYIFDNDIEIRREIIWNSVTRYFDTLNGATEWVRIISNNPKNYEFIKLAKVW